MSVVLRHVDPLEAKFAFHWHRGFAAANEHIFPRTWEHYKDLADDWQIIVAHEDADYLGLAYYVYDETESSWEVGGLMVATSQRGKGLGTTLMCVALGHLLFDNDPLSDGQSVISHVHKNNQAPRKIIADRLQFSHRRTIEVNGNELPGLQTDDDGIVHGDEFEIKMPDSLIALAEWCEQWDGRLFDGHPAQIHLREPGTLENWAQAFREMAA